MSNQRKCDAVGCQTPVRVGRFMCITHWKMVPLPLQRTINARYRALPNARDLLSDPAYLEACAKAIERGQPLREDGLPTNSYRRLLTVLASKNGGTP